DAPVAVFVFLARETLFECGDRRIELGRDVLMPLAHLLYLADAGLSDRRRRAEPARVIRVPYAVIPGVLAGLDQQQHIVTPVAGDDAVRAGRLDLGDIGRKVLHLLQR